MPQKGVSNNPNGRPRSERSQRALEGVEAVFGSSFGFWKQVAKQAEEGCLVSQRMIASRIEAPLKPRSGPVAISLPEYDNVTEVVPAIISAVASGEIGPDEAAKLLTALNQGAQLEKLEALETRIDALDSQS